MTQHTDLIERLSRQSAELADTGRTLDYSAGVAAANALEAQAREIAKLKAQESELCTLYGLAQAECNRLRKDAERFLALERIVHWEQERDMGPGGRYWMAVHVSSGNPTLREAIDAMKGQS